MADDRIVMPAVDLVRGDQIAATFLPLGRPADVEGAFPYTLNGNPWVLLVYRTPDGYPFAEAFYGHVNVPLTRLGDRGMGYSREPEHLQPVPVPDGVAGYQISTATLDGEDDD